MMRPAVARLASRYFGSNLTRSVCVTGKDYYSVTKFINHERNYIKFNKQTIFTTKSNSIFTSNYLLDVPSHDIITLPNLSPTMESGGVVSWAKKEGDRIDEGDLLAEIETDKATMGLEASDTGYIAKILIPAGTKDLPIGTKLCVVVENEEDVAAFADFQIDTAADSTTKTADAPATKESTPAPSKPSDSQPKAEEPPADSGHVSSHGSASGGDRLFISPLARRLAAEKGADLGSIGGSYKGSGFLDSIRSKDLNSLLESIGSTGGSSGGAGAPLYNDIPLTAMRSTIAKRLSQSKKTIPHYNLTIDVNIDNLMKLREALNAKLKKASVKLSVNDFIIKAAAMACLEVPDCNSSWQETFIRQYESVDINVAVSTPNGLITPIIFDAHAKGLKTINTDVVNLAGKAREGKLKPQEFQGGTFTISNLGMFGVNHFNAIINPPQACILAVGTSEKRLCPGSSNEPVAKTYLSVSLCCDHRVVDGAVGAQWLAVFKEYVENPGVMLLN